MRRFGLLAALAGARTAGDGALRERLRQRLGQRLAERRGVGGAPAGALAERPGNALQAGNGLDAASPVLPPGVTVQRDVAYGSDPAQRLDIYTPAGARGAPVVLFVHGGGWRRGDKAMPQMAGNKLAHWAARGWVYASTNYRMLPAADVVQQASDVARALAWVQQQIAAHGGDPQRVALVGHSAGAHLAALLTADPALAAAEDAAPWQASVLIDSAALDIEALMSRPHFRFYDPVFGTDPVFWRAASPQHRLQGRPVAPTLLVCSGTRVDSEPPARAFAAKAVAQGGTARVLHVGLGHMAINDQLGLPGDYTDAVDSFLLSNGLA